MLVFLGRLKFKQWQNQRRVEKEKQSLMGQVDALEKKNDQLKQSLQYLNSPSFKERVARQQLDLKKEGEQVYSFSERLAVSGDGDGNLSESNAKKWWNYFFLND